MVHSMISGAATGNPPNGLLGMLDGVEYASLVSRDMLDRIDFIAHDGVGWQGITKADLPVARRAATPKVTVKLSHDNVSAAEFECVLKIASEIRLLAETFAQDRPSFRGARRAVPPHPSLHAHRNLASAINSASKISKSYSVEGISQINAANSPWLPRVECSWCPFIRYIVPGGMWYSRPS